MRLFGTRNAQPSSLPPSALPASKAEQQEQAVQMEISEIIRNLMISPWKLQWASTVAIIAPLIFWFFFGLGNGYVFYGSRWFTPDLPGLAAYLPGFATDSVAISLLFLMPVYKANGESGRYNAARFGAIILIGFSMITQFTFLQMDPTIGVHLAGNETGSALLNGIRAVFMGACEYYSCTLIAKSALSLARKVQIESEVRKAQMERNQDKALLSLQQSVADATTNAFEAIGENARSLNESMKGVMALSVQMMTAMAQRQMAQMQQIQEQLASGTALPAIAAPSQQEASAAPSEQMPVADAEETNIIPFGIPQAPTPLPPGASNGTYTPSK